MSDKETNSGEPSWQPGTWKKRFSLEARVAMGSAAPVSSGFRAPYLNFNISPPAGAEGRKEKVKCVLTM